MSLKMNPMCEEAEENTLTKNSNGFILDCMVLELQKGLINDLYWLFKESNNYNLLITVGDSPNIKSFKAHSSVLSARSLYFRALLSSGHHLTSNKNDSLIEITQTNIESEVFDVILKFIYTGKIILENEKEVERLFDYIIAAEKLWLFQLTQYIESYLIYQMDEWLRTNFIYVFTKLVSNPSSFKLLHEFADDILKNHSGLLFDSIDFCKLPESSLIHLLQNRKFPKNKSEDQIWELVLNWGIYQNIDLIRKDVSKWAPLDFIKLQNTLQRCIPLIRFAEFPPNVFYDVVEPYRLTLTPNIYETVTQSPKFVAYEQSTLNSRSKETSKSSLSVQSKPSITKSKLQQNPQIKLSHKFIDGHASKSSSTPPSSLIHERVVSPLSSVINQNFFEPTLNSSSLTAPKHQSLSSISSKSSASSVTRRSSKSKYSVKKRNRTLSYMRQNVLLVKQTNSVSPTIHTLVKRKSKPTYVFSIETATESKSSTSKSKSESKSVKSESESRIDVTQPTISNSIEPSKASRISDISDIDPLITRKSKGRANRKTSIIANSNPPTPPIPNVNVSVF